MYVIERLKQEFPERLEELTVYDRFLRRYHEKEWVEKIFDDSKENFKFIHKAFENYGVIGEFNRNMAYYERSLNDDLDFLKFFVEKYYPEDYKNDLTVDELKTIIKG